MTVTDQPIATDLPCVCGCPKWDHKQGRAVCKGCTFCQHYEPTADAELAHLRTRVEELEQAVTVIAAERDEAVLRANQAASKNARVTVALADAEAALVEAHKGLRLSNAEHLHQRLSAAALVIGRLRDWRYCPLCREISEPSGARHVCGRMAPVDVLLIRRPNPPTTEEQP